MANEFVVVSDIHGNYPALQEVVDTEGSDKEYIVLGDIHGLCAYPAETQSLIREISEHVLAGNHDKAIFQKNEGHVSSDQLSQFELFYTKAQLSHLDENYMRALPHLDVLTRGGQRICLTHALPFPEQASGYESGNLGIPKREVPHYASVVSDDYDWVFHGHTHEQYDLDCSQFAGQNDVHFVNPGSLGYQQSYSVVDIEAGEVEHKSVDVDMDSVRAHVQENLPEGAPPASKWL